MTHSSLNLVPPAPFPQPLASDVDDIPAVIVDEADLPTAQESSKDIANNNEDDGQVEPRTSHPQGVDAGEGDKDHKVFNVNDDGMIRDSLTLGELRRYVDGGAFKAKKPRQYAFEYSDTESVIKEIEEFFAYRDIRALQEGMRIFEENHPTPWIHQPVTDKMEFIRLQLSYLDAADADTRRCGLLCLAHLAQGVFGEVINADHQMQWVTENTKLLRKCGAFEVVYTSLRASCKWMDCEENDSQDVRCQSGLEIKCASSILYIMLVVECEDSFEQEVASLDPPFIPWLIEIISLMRSKEPSEQAQRYPKQLAPLLHKSILLLFGDTKTTLNMVKDYVRTKLNLPPLAKSMSTITTNPLDYHLFREEIISKYPTYTPPPLSVRENLIADPIFTTTSSEPSATTTNYYDGTGGPVHIATPAPSPPPSPKLKKSIYQTDQTVPLLLPGSGEVPRSIVEAGRLYAERMRISSATVQMWNEKEKFTGYVKGFWDYEGQDPDEPIDESHPAGIILQRVEDTYREALPHLQGMVVALLQLLLANFTASTMPTFSHLDEEQRPDTPEELETAMIDTTREKEILGKVITGTILLLLKWFRVSHVLKFEFLSQLLYDSNYHILMARLLGMDTPVLSIPHSSEIPSLGLFSFPFRDSALPPPIARRRNPPPMTSSPNPEDTDNPPPITDFSWRSLFITTNLLRILQKVVKRKPYRNLQLVQMRLAQALRKQYKIPSEMVVYYVLKIIKGQVPYSGRKWRQTNMRFITSVYMMIRPELREDWLTTGDIEAEVEDAQPQENALRAMTHYYNVRRYPEEMAETGRGELEEGEVRWFRRLLEEMSLTTVSGFSQEDQH